MKKIAILAATVALLAPGLSFAQGASSGLTRAQVRAELKQFRDVGYQASGENVNYPDDVQQALARIAQKEATRKANANGEVSQRGTDDTARPMTVPTPECVGPVSYCNVYFGG
ncbi:DUF4148 domain-containing protein [Paraburkholderia humisilvae]|uniref:DUF4148 domain-containing protein n=1 Tax=Paraburkholderia humisilvae TaxID=627669 RepID=A0A6J5F372_9BURK|nr:DUF4148 domain-containing protein [Paraburkholderia humisilvae]CAB3773279.1 hypothetical protein LMG29542_07170 [Paraburkholderia humisilvae]